jgi:hypothetical protein
MHIWHDSASSITGDHTVLTFTWNGTRYESRLTLSTAWKSYIQDDTNQYLYFDYALFDRYNKMMSDCYWWSSDDTESHSSPKIIASANNDDLPNEYDVGSYTLEELRDCCYLDTMIQYTDQHSNFKTLYETSLSGNTIQIVVE